LNVFPLELPSLRERRLDIPLLVEYFTHRFAKRAGKSVRGISKDTLELLQSYEWPGNLEDRQAAFQGPVPRTGVKEVAAAVVRFGVCSTLAIARNERMSGVR
jgi:transcriptional regulator with GAF, ATPase, and Fis domain